MALLDSLMFQDAPTSAPSTLECSVKAVSRVNLCLRHLDKKWSIELPGLTACPPSIIQTLKHNKASRCEDESLR